MNQQTNDDTLPLGSSNLHRKWILGTLNSLQLTRDTPQRNKQTNLFYLFYQYVFYLRLLSQSVIQSLSH